MVVGMLVGCSMGSWCITLGSLGSPVTKLTADVASAMKSGSGAKFHGSVTMIISLNGNRYSNMTFPFIILVYMSCGKG